MKKKNSKVVIVLTAEQVQELSEQQLIARNKGGESGMHIGQIFLYADGTGCIACGIIESEQAKEIQKIMGSKGTVRKQTHDELKAFIKDHNDKKNVKVDVQTLMDGAA